MASLSEHSFATITNGKIKINLISIMKKSFEKANHVYKYLIRVGKLKISQPDLWIK